MTEVTGAAPGVVRRVFLVDNPVAGRGLAPHVAESAQQHLVAAGVDVVRVRSDTADPASELSAKLGPAAERRNDDAVVVIGGDGTVNVALAAVADTHTRLGIIPVGTGNDTANELGLPHEPDAAVRAVIAACRSGAERRIDAVRWRDDGGKQGWFVSVLGMGFDSLVNERANGWSWPRGRRRYDLAVLRELAAFRPRPFTLTIDEVTRHVDAVLVAVGNLPSYGGGLRICDGAAVDDGLLNIVVIGAVSRIDLARLYPSVPRGGHLKHPAATVLQGRQVRAECEGIVGYADGERLAALPLSCEVHPRALRVLG